MSYDINELIRELSEVDKKEIIQGHYMLNIGFPELPERILKDDELFQKILKAKIKTYSLKILDEIINEINKKIIEIPSEFNKNDKKLNERYNEGLKEAALICIGILFWKKCKYTFNSWIMRKEEKEWHSDKN